MSGGEEALEYDWRIYVMLCYVMSGRITIGAGVHATGSFLWGSWAAADGAMAGAAVTCVTPAVVSMVVSGEAMGAIGLMADPPCSASVCGRRGGACIYDRA